MKKYFPIILVVSCIVILWTLYQFKKEPCHLNSNQNKNRIIEQALTLELPPTNTTSSEKADRISKEAFKKVQDGNYEEAIALTVAGLTKFPRDFILQSDLAALLGDCSEITAPPLKNSMIEKSKIMFERLLREADGQPKEVWYSFKNEYYFRFALYREQYELGLMRVAEYWGTNEWASRGFNGYYSQGVGAANYARKLIEQGNRSLALDYAQKALVAWAQYFSYENDYYNAYVHYALALGILGYKEEMMQALQRSAHLIEKDLDYHEFKEVITFVDEAEKRGIICSG